MKDVLSRLNAMEKEVTSSRGKPLGEGRVS